MLISESSVPVLESDVLGNGISIQEQIWKNLTTRFEPYKAMATDLEKPVSLTQTMLELSGLTPGSAYNSINLAARIIDEEIDALYVLVLIDHKSDDTRRSQGKRPRIFIQPHSLHLDRITTHPARLAQLAEAVWDGVSDDAKDNMAKRFLAVFEDTAQKNLVNIPASKIKEEAEGDYRTDWEKWEQIQKDIISLSGRLKEGMNSGHINRAFSPTSATLKYTLP